MSEFEEGVPKEVQAFEAPKQPREEERSDDDAKFRELVATQTSRWFESGEDAHERSERMTKALEPFCEELGEEGEAMLEEVRSLEGVTDKDGFLARYMAAVEPVIEMRSKKPDVFEALLKESTERAGNREFLSDLLIVEDEIVDGTAEIHLYDTGELEKYKNLEGFEKMQMVRKDVKRGLAELAARAHDNPEIQRVHGYSWLIARQPKLFERYGFVLDEKEPVFNEESGRVERGATLSREELLSRFLKAS